MLTFCRIDLLDSCYLGFVASILYRKRNLDYANCCMQGPDNIAKPIDVKSRDAFEGEVIILIP